MNDSSDSSEEIDEKVIRSHDTIYFGSSESSFKQFEYMLKPNTMPNVPKYVKLVIYSYLSANNLLCKASKFNKETRKLLKEN